MSACVTLADLLEAYRVRLRTVLGSSGQALDVRVADDVQPLDEQSALVQSAGVAVWSSATERDESLGGVNEDRVRDSIHVEISTTTAIRQEESLADLLHIEDAVRVALLGGWDGEPCATLIYVSTARDRDGSRLMAQLTFESLRTQANG